MNCVICGQSLDRSGSSTDAQWILSRENQLAAEDVNGDLCAECGQHLEQRSHSGMPADYHLTKQPIESDDREQDEQTYPVRMEDVESRRPEK
jgi:hypothetical protein